MDEMNELLQKIEVLRKEMIDMTSKKGMTCDESLMISQELDQLINMYQKKQLNNKKNSRGF